MVDLERFHAQVGHYQLLPHALEAPFAVSVLRDIALGIPTLLMLWRPARALSLDGRLFAGPQTLEPGSAALNQVRAGS